MYRIQFYSEPALVDSVIPGMEMVHFKDPELFSDESPKSCSWRLDAEVIN